MNQSLVSIGMPVYNGERYLEAAIRSNLEQTHSDLELLISDNASTDGTEAICRSFVKSDGRVRYSRNSQNIGAAANYNSLFEAARGEFFRWSNADDIASPRLLESALPILQSSGDVVIAFGRTCLIDAEGRHLSDYDDKLDLQDNIASARYLKFTSRGGLTNVIYGLMRSRAMARTGLMGSGKLPAGDVNFLAAMVLLGKFVEIPETLFYRRMHADAFSALEDSRAERKFWSASESTISLPLWRSWLTDTKAIALSPLPVGQKAELLAFAAKQLFWQRADFAKDALNLFPIPRNRLGRRS